MLLHQGAPPKLMDAVPPMLPPHTVAVALATIRLLRSVAELDLQMFQVRFFFFFCKWKLHLFQSQTF